MEVFADLDDVMADQERTISVYVSDLLARWHSWSAGHSMTHSYPMVSSSFRDARASRQYDDANGGLDAHIDCVLMEAVDAVIDAISDPWRTALSIQARNLQTGSSVWTSPRLPTCMHRRAEMLVEARKKFVEGLARRNML